MIQPKNIKNVFFLGIGGIGMSALARYFNRDHITIYGYDRTPSPLTNELEAEGMQICYEDDVAWLDSLGLVPQNTLVIRTPAVPEDNDIYTQLREKGFDIHKRAEVLGLITREKKALCVAGTHGKTTTSTMLAHLLVATEKGTNAFLGGISLNYDTNVLVNPQSEYVVVEADEYDRSFHYLHPYISVVTAVDADHLDIYGTEEAYRQAFVHYTSLITHVLVMKQGIDLQPCLQKGVKCYTYAVLTGDQSQTKDQYPDFYADNIRIGEGSVVFDFHTPKEVINDVRLGVPVWVNIENAVAAMSVAWIINTEEKSPVSQMKAAIASFKGVQRRFNIHVNKESVVYIDDYAHHPQEIATAIRSIRILYPNRHLIGVFQPHLYTRTRDFADDFARVLSNLDDIILLPVYPAREKPIPGVTSEMLRDKINNELRFAGKQTEAQVVQKNDLTGVLAKRLKESDKPLVFLTVGAGDIDRLIPEITRVLMQV